MTSCRLLWLCSTSSGCPRRLCAQTTPARVLGPLLGVSSKVEWRPFGVVGCISPWNYPFQLAIFAIAPALFAGNTVVLKPSEVTPGVGELLRTVLEGLPPGVATVVQGGADVGKALVDAPCDKICFIGSPATGRKIAGAAAKHLTPVVMELGGQDAAIVCDDADLDVATSGVLWGAFLNSGQTCAAIERAYVVDSVADEFTERLASKLAQLRHEENGDIGALTTSAGLDTVTRLVQDSIEHGATVIAGGPDEIKRSEQKGRWYPATILDGRSEEMAVFKEEIFGPVLPIVRVRDEAEAVRRANEDGFSLTASVWTRNRARFDRLAGELRAGTVSNNDHASTVGAVWTPWGGVGESGYGRINGIYGLREFSVPVHVARSIAPEDEEGVVVSVRRGHDGDPPCVHGCHSRAHARRESQSGEGRGRLLQKGRQEQGLAGVWELEDLGLQTGERLPDHRFDVEVRFCRVHIGQTSLGGGRAWFEQDTAVLVLPRRDLEGSDASCVVDDLELVHPDQGSDHLDRRHRCVHRLKVLYRL